MKLGKNAIYVIGLAIFLGAMLFFSDLMMAIFAPVITMFGMFAFIALFFIALVGAWMMKRGTSPT